MLKTVRIFMFMLLAMILSNSPKLMADQPAGVYQVKSHHRPTSTGGVNQNLASRIPAYASEGGSGWWFCGHAAIASSMNYLRQSTVSTDNKITQLQWFHEQLSSKQSSYSSDPHRRASLDGLEKVVRLEKAEEFSVKKITGSGSTGRANVRDQMLDTLKKYSSYAVVLSETTIGGTVYGHFYAVYKIDYQPGTPTGGTVYFWDPHAAKLGQMGFSTLMDGMRDAGTQDRYSFLRLYKN